MGRCDRRIRQPQQSTIHPITHGIRPVRNPNFLILHRETAQYDRFIRQIATGNTRAILDAKVLVLNATIGIRVVRVTAVIGVQAFCLRDSKICVLVDVGEPGLRHVGVAAAGVD